MNWAVTAKLDIDTGDGYKGVLYQSKRRSSAEETGGISHQHTHTTGSSSSESTKGPQMGRCLTILFFNFCSSVENILSPDV